MKKAIALSVMLGLGFTTAALAENVPVHQVKPSVHQHDGDQRDGEHSRADEKAPPHHDASRASHAADRDSSAHPARQPGHENDERSFLDEGKRGNGEHDRDQHRKKPQRDGRHNDDKQHDRDSARGEHHTDRDGKPMKGDDRHD